MRVGRVEPEEGDEVEAGLLFGGGPLVAEEKLGVEIDVAEAEGGFGSRSGFWQLLM